MGLAAHRHEAPAVGVGRLRVGGPLAEAPAGIHALCDVKGMIAERYDARDGSAYLIRPDQHIAARMRTASVDRIRQAVARASAQH